jgi:hypothetical protein
MIITVAIILVSIFALAFFSFQAVRGHGAAVQDIAGLQGRTQPVDLLAFRNLTSPIQEQYLREHLPPRTFRSVQRQRLRAAIAYLDCVTDNAAVLLRLGEAARHSPDPQLAEAGLLLVNNALRVRLFAFSARARFYLAFVFPGLQASPKAVSDSYETLTGTVQRLGYLQTGSPGRSATAAVL